MKTIAFLIPKVHNQGGVARVSSMITDGLFNQQKKYRILIIGYTSGDKIGYDWNDQLKYYTIFKESRSLTKGLVKGTEILRKILAKESVDLLVSCDSNLSFLCFTATRFNKTKLLYWDHTNFFENTSHKFKKESKRVMAMFANAIVVLTKTDKKSWNKHTNAKHVFQIYNPVKPVKNINNYNLISNKIISVGRLTYQKNFRIIPEIAKNLKDKGVLFEWHIYGAGDQEQDIINEIKNHDLLEDVFLMGHKNMNNDIYSQYALMAMTSNYEGFPMVLLEGLTHKLPLISFDIDTGPNEIIINNVNGFLVKAFDINTYVDKLEFLLKNEKERNNISVKTAVKLKEFEFNNIINQWVDLFDDILND